MAAYDSRKAANRPAKTGLIPTPSATDSSRRRKTSDVDDGRISERGSADRWRIFFVFFDTFNTDGSRYNSAAKTVNAREEWRRRWDLTEATTSEWLKVLERRRRRWSWHLPSPGGCDALPMASAAAAPAANGRSPIPRRRRPLATGCCCCCCYRGSMATSISTADTLLSFGGVGLWFRRGGQQSPNATGPAAAASLASVISQCRRNALQEPPQNTRLLVKISNM